MFWRRRPPARSAASLRAAALLAALALTASARAQAPVDVNARLRELESSDSRVMDVARALTDRFPARLTGSPQAVHAAKWAAARLESWGFAGVVLEPWDFGSPGWSNERAAARIVAPFPFALTVKAVAWTPGTRGPVRARAVLITPPDAPTAPELQAYLTAQADSVRGRIVLVGAPTGHPGQPPTFDSRLRDEELRDRYGPPKPRVPRAPAEARPDVLSAAEQHTAIDLFLRRHGAVARVWGSRDGYGLMRAVTNPHRDVERCVTGLVTTQEDYGRIARLLADGVLVEIEIDVTNTLYPEGRTAYHVVAELAGRERPGELVVLGAHLDGHHVASAASDNAAGVAIAMEAARLVRALNIPLRRSVRLILWSGEEQRVAGSQAYVRQHFGSFEAPKPGFPLLSACFNLDNGSGRIRGMHIFGPPAAAEALAAILEPFAADGVVGATTYRNRTAPGSDHAAFSVNGLPGVWIDQDPLDYPLTWHSTADTFERIADADARQAAVVLAAAVYHVAQRDELLPRFDKASMPAPGSR